MNLAPPCLRILGRRVVVCRELPPIPTSLFDYSATFQGYDEGDPIGRGRTPVDAVADLKEQAEQREQST